MNGFTEESSALFRHLTCAHRLAVQEELAREGCPRIGQPRILFLLDKRGQNGVISTQRELAQLLHVSAATVTTSLKSLERQGYVRTVTDEKDARRKQVVITPQGREAMVRCVDVFKRVHERMYADFTAEELEQIQNYHARMLENLQPLLSRKAEEMGAKK